MTETQPKHGEQRNRRYETTLGPIRELVAADSDEVVYRGPLFSSTSTVSDRYCATCGAWITCRGILAWLACPQCETEW